jgi:hypothetical protein
LEHRFSSAGTLTFGTSTTGLSPAASSSTANPDALLLGSSLWFEIMQFHLLFLHHDQMSNFVEHSAQSWGVNMFHGLV